VGEVPMFEELEPIENAFKVTCPFCGKTFLVGVPLKPLPVKREKPRRKENPGKLLGIQTLPEEPPVRPPEPMPIEPYKPVREGKPVFKGTREDLLNIIANYIASLNYGDTFTIRDLREATGLDKYAYDHLLRGLGILVKRFEQQGWIEEVERKPINPKYPYDKIKVYRCLLNKKPSKEEIEKIRKSEVL